MNRLGGGWILPEPNAAQEIAELRRFYDHDDPEEEVCREMCARLSIRFRDLTFLFEVLSDWNWDSSKRPFRYVANAVASVRLEELVVRRPNRREISVGSPLELDEYTHAVRADEERASAFSLSLPEIKAGASLTNAEYTVMKAKIDRIGRKEAMDGCSDPIERRSVQAAWRRYDKSVRPRIEAFWRTRLRK